MLVPSFHYPVLSSSPFWLKLFFFPQIPPSTCCFGVCGPLSLNEVVCMSMCGEIHEGVRAPECLDHWGEWHLFSKLSLHAQSPSGRGAALRAISSRMKHWMAQSYAGLVQVIHLLWIHNRVIPVCQPITSTKSVSQQYSSTSGAYNLSFPSSVMFSEPSTPQSRFLCTRTVVSLWTNHRPTQKAVFWQGPRAVIIHGYKDKYLEGSLVLCPFSRIMLVDFPTRAPCLFMIYIFSNF